jgi:hypothetical protein
MTCCIVGGAATQTDDAAAEEHVCVSMALGCYVWELCGGVGLLT